MPVPNAVRLQLALANMDVRDEKISREQFYRSEGDVYSILRKLHEAKISPEVIDGPVSLDSALMYELASLYEKPTMYNQEILFPQRNPLPRNRIIIEKNSNNLH